MKRFLAVLILIIVLTALTGCFSKSSDNTDEAEENSDEVVLSGVFSDYDVDEISRLSGYKCKVSDYMPEEVLLKVLAGDSDVDIYILADETVRQFKEKGIYYPIESQTVKDFNDRCFDNMRELAIDGNGDTIGMIIDSTTRALIYPSALESETGIDIQSLSTLEEVLGFIQNYSGERKGYISYDDCFYYELLGQYEKYFCDFPKKTFDYKTDIYKNIFESTLLKRNEDGKLDSFYGLIPIGYGGFLKTDINVNELFMADASYLDLISKGSEFVSGLRAIPLPKINDDCKNCASAQYAVINPSSKNKEGAVKVLETIAENRDSVGIYYGRYPLIYKDISDYSDSYFTDTQVFKDYYNIAANGFITEYWFGCYQYRQDVDDYRNGVITADEAIAEYQRMIDIWLNE